MRIKFTGTVSDDILKQIFISTGSSMSSARFFEYEVNTFELNEQQREAFLNNLPANFSRTLWDKVDLRRTSFNVGQVPCMTLLEFVEYVKKQYLTTKKRDNKNTEEYYVSDLVSLDDLMENGYHDSFMHNDYDPMRYE